MDLALTDRAAPPLEDEPRLRTEVGNPGAGLPRYATNGKLWCLLSGGKDSVCAAHVLAGQDRLAGCVYLETGIGVPETRPFVERLCTEMGWRLRVEVAPITYEQLVLRWGFPKGPWGHRRAYGWLKERGIIRARKEIGGDPVFASGARISESDRRARSIARGFRHNGGVRIVNPIEDWSSKEVWRYLRERGIPTSPAYTWLGRSGDCLCGSFSQKGEADLIRRLYPSFFERIQELERTVTEAGKYRFPYNRWGSTRTLGGFSALRGRQTLESMVCGGDCASMVIV